MGNDEPVAPSKSDKASSPVQEQLMVHPYPDWAAMQAYYSSGVPMPPPYFNSVVAPGHPPHPYMWGPQPLMPPFATPYTAIYPHGVYPHPPIVSPSTTDLSAKSSNIKDGGLVKKFKGSDGLDVSVGNINVEIAVADGSGQSHSGENGAEGSSDASDEKNESGGKENQNKRRSEDTQISGVVVSPSTINCKLLGTLPAPTQLKAGARSENWTQDERELKREKRKQSNRESARRSRLRKQAETEELTVKVEGLCAENTSLRSEIRRFKENLEKVRAENSSLMAKLNDVEEGSRDGVENQEVPSVVVENFLSRIDELRQDENCEAPKGGELRQLLDSNRRTDPVVAG